MFLERLGRKVAELTGVLPIGIDTSTEETEEEGATRTRLPVIKYKFFDVHTLVIHSTDSKDVDNSRLYYAVVMNKEYSEKDDPEGFLIDAYKLIEYLKENQISLPRRRKKETDAMYVTRVAKEKPWYTIELILLLFFERTMVDNSNNSNIQKED